MTYQRSDLLWNEIGSENCVFRASKEVPPTVSWIFGTICRGIYEYYSLHAQGIRIGAVQQIGSFSNSPHLEQAFAELLGFWASMITQPGTDPSQEMLQELSKTAIMNDRGYPGDTIQRDAINASNHKRLVLDALCGRRRFIVTDSGHMGMAPPHV